MSKMKQQTIMMINKTIFENRFVCKNMWQTFFFILTLFFIDVVGAIKNTFDVKLETIKSQERNPRQESW